AARVSGLLGVPEDQVLRSLARRDTGFVYLARNVPAEKAAKIQRMQIPGLEFIPEYRRTYPRDWMAAQLLGSVGTDDPGLGGLRYDFDKGPQGTTGERKLVKDGMGTPIEMRDTKPVRPGRTIRLTLDANLQDQAESVLSE